MKTLQWAAAALAVGALALPARAETVTTNDWWDVKFESPTPSVSVNNIAYGGTTFTEGKLGALTNNASTAGYDAQVQQNQPWASGYWAMVDGDESYWTNEWYVAEGDMPTFTNSYLKLDTQGNDLTWTPTNSAIELTTLVDADLYLVGSDSPPDTDDFDSAKDVQTAIYLKNEIDEGSGETTNSVLCVYVEDALSGNPYWQELKGVKLDDNSWAHIQVLVDHTGDPKVSVFVNGTQMSARDGSDIAWTIAHSTSDGAKEHKIHSVAFRGTGAVDNFAGKTLQTSYEEAFFKAEVFMNNQIVAEGETGNSTRVAKAEIGTDKTVTFEDFWFHDYDQDNGHPMTFNLVKIDIVDFSTGTTNTINYIVDSNRQITPGSGSGVTFLTTELDFEGTSYVIQTGEFKISIPTQGAVDTTNTIARIYFEDLPEVGTYNAIATTTVGETTTSDAKKVRPSEFAEGATKTITWEFPAVKDGNLLTTVQVSNGATLEYANKTATVTVTLDGALAADTLFAAATYGTGSLAEGQDLKWTVENGLYTFTSYTPPVAIIVADSGATTNEYETLAAAVAAVPENAADATTITLVANITMSSSVTIPANKLVALDMAKHAITGPANAFVFGVLGELAVDGEGSITAMVPFYLGGEGALVVESGSFTGTYSAVLFADGADGASVTVNGGTLTAPDAIGSSGKNVTIAVHGGTVSATDGCAIATNGSNGKGGNVITVDGGTIQAAITSEGYVAGGIHAANADTVTFGGKAVMNVTGGAGIVARGGTVSVTGGSITTTGDATGKVGNAGGIPCAAIVFDTAAAYPGYDAATSKITVSGGTFVSAVDPVQQVKAAGDATAIEVAGGWFSAPVAADFVAAGKVCAQDAANAPSEAATWTVEGAKVTVTWVITETSSNMVQVAVGSQVSAYAGEDVVNGTKKFKFWSTDGTTEASFPVTAEGNLTFFAVWEDAAVDPIAVTIGGDAVNALPANVEPITLDADGFTLRFAAKQTGVTYILQSATTVNGQFADVTVEDTVVSKTPTAVDQVVELTDPDTASTVKFFRVRVVVAE